MSNKEYLIELMDKYVTGRLTEVENNALMEMLDNDEYAPELDRIFQESYQQSGDQTFWSEQYREVFVSRLMERARASGSLDGIKTARRIHFLKTAWFKYAAAILITLGAGAYLWNTTSTRKDVASTKGNKQLQTDIRPGGEKAVLTLADGTKIVLDNAANGNLAQQGSTQVVKMGNGQIAYNVKGLSEKDILLNNLSTPAGGQYQITLPDGTKVWLNAASSITYPAAFVSTKRQVKVTGEVYFEVAKNKELPFVVDINGKSTVQVLGTSFNINSYENEGSIKTTLLKGSVKVTKDDEESVLKPGQQAVIKFSDRQPKDVADILIHSNADLDQTLAWKNGLFSFNDTELRSVMRQLERWYDIQVRYDGQISDVTLKGKMYRNVNLSDVLEFLQTIGIKTRMEGKTLIVL